MVDLGPAVPLPVSSAQAPSAVAAVGLLAVSLGGRPDTITPPHLVADPLVAQFLALVPLQARLVSGVVLELEPVMEQPGALLDLRAAGTGVARGMPQADLDQNPSEPGALNRIESRAHDVRQGDHTIGQLCLAAGPGQGPQAKSSQTIEVASQGAVRERHRLGVDLELVIDLEEHAGRDPSRG